MGRLGDRSGRPALDEAPGWWWARSITSPQCDKSGRADERPEALSKQVFLNPPRARLDFIPYDSAIPFFLLLLLYTRST